MELDFASLIAGGALGGLSAFVVYEGLHRLHLIDHARNRLTGHRPARPMNYTNGREKLQAYLDEQRRNRAG